MRARKDLLDQYDHIAANCAMFAARRLSRSLARLYDSALAPSGLRATQYNILVAIARDKTESLSDLGTVLGMDRTTLTHALRALARDNLVTVERGDDERTRVLSLTPLGQRRVAAAIPLWKAAQAVVEKGFGMRRWQSLKEEIKQLNKIVRNAGSGTVKEKR